MDVHRYDGTPSSTDDWSAVFVGDCLPPSDLFPEPIGQNVRELISAAELSVANLEAPLPSGEPIAKPAPAHSVPDETPTVLESSGFDVVTLANNHMIDYGAAGLDRTMDACRDAGLETVGAGECTEAALTPLTDTISGTDVALFALSQRWPSNVAEADAPGVAWIDAPGVTRAVRRASANNDVCIVVLHGGVGYSPLPSPAWQTRARSFVDLGADAVVCHHPHVAQGWETYQGAPIFYSLGNFLFPTSKPSTRWTCSARLAVTDDEIGSADVVLTHIEDDTVELLDPEASGAKQWNHLERLSEIIQSYPESRGYWQEVAARLFEQRFEEILQEYGCGPVQSLVRFPEQEAGRLLDGTSPGEGRRLDQQKQLLTQFQQESFRNVIVDTLAVRTGTTVDDRTDAIEAEVDELMRWVDRFPQPSRTDVWRYRLRALYRNLKPT
ncbi:MAG: CapA family protein [Halovenus sp.]